MNVVPAWESIPVEMLFLPDALPTPLVPLPASLPQLNHARAFNPLNLGSSMCVRRCMHAAKTTRPPGPGLDPTNTLFSLVNAVPTHTLEAVLYMQHRQLGSSQRTYVGVCMYVYSYGTSRRYYKKNNTGRNRL